ncbi:MAG: hypothetical protein MMC33_001902 [Icmadophila ericetorum]|nr:hypothetical protein [Icmadophila ericetorum]
MAVDYENDLVLLTAAGGKQVAHILHFISGKWKRIRLVVNGKESQKRLSESYPQAEVMRADLTLPQDCKRALAGVTTIFHTGPSFHPHETALSYMVIDAALEEAKNSEFQHFILSSVLNSQLRKLIHHDEKKMVEEYIMESGLNYTILQPGHFMDMFPIKKLLAEGSPVYPARWNLDIPFSYLSAHDLGEATAIVMAEREKHYLAQYPLVSTHLSGGYRQVCSIASKIIGKEIRIEQMSFEDIINGPIEQKIGLPPHPATRDIAQRMLLYYNFHGLVGNPNILEWLLRRKPLSWEAWIEMKMKDEKAESRGAHVA